MSPSAREWLLRLERTPGAWAELLEVHGGSLALAAHCLARAKCAVRGYVEPVPTSHELHVAAREIHARAKIHTTCPKRHALADECIAEGLLVVFSTR